MTFPPPDDCFWIASETDISINPNNGWLLYWLWPECLADVFGDAYKQPAAKLEQKPLPIEQMPVWREPVTAATVVLPDDDGQLWVISGDQYPTRITR